MPEPNRYRKRTSFTLAPETMARLLRILQRHSHLRSISTVIDYLAQQEEEREAAKGRKA